MLNKLKLKPIYRTHKDSIAQDFYIPCFSESIYLYRAAGFFSLHSLALTIDGLIRFIRKGGKINLICSPDISQKDAELIDACVSLDKDHITKSLLESIVGVQLTDEELFQLDIICNMLSEGILTIKIAYQPLGIFHEKFGIFIDEADGLVYFNGSMNETRRALVQNQESISVNCSWESPQRHEMIKGELEYFNSLWNNNEESIVVIDFPEAVKNEMLNCYKRSETLESAIDKYISGHAGKTKKTLFSYQKDAIEEFCSNGYHHFYEMATGTGKTFTAIKTIRELRKRTDEHLFTIICVPQIDLQVQWEESLKEEGYNKVYLFGGNGTSYDQTASEAIIDFYSDENDVVCVAVYDTFFSKFYIKAQKISSLFLIVDEAHNLTGGNLSLLKKLNPKYRLGLSATIRRYNESESSAIAEFFTPSKPFYYGIEDAINNGFLSQYEYHPIFVYLTEDENKRFKVKTKQIAQEKSKDEPDQEVLDRLRRERSLILKQASRKIEKLKELTETGYDFVNAVVYCGQGKDDEGEQIIDSVTKILYESGRVVSQFTSKTTDRPTVLYEFEHGYYDTLVAIKCFDEGVDVPKLDKIYIMASDSALRQTVQRRGRVLRKCKESGKTIAYIYDMFVLPAPEDGTFGSEGLLRIELDRAKEYNRLALNKDDNVTIFENLESKYHVISNESNDEYD